MQKFKHMNEQEILSEIQRLESEADKLEKKLESLTMEEQAEWDQHIPFSIEKYDKEVEDKMTEYFTKKELQKALEAGEVENVEEDAKLAAHISPELEEFAQKYLEKQDKVNMRMIEKIKEKTQIRIPEEDWQQILDEVMNKDGLEDQETAQKYFNEMWERLSKYKVKVLPRKPQYLTKDQIDGKEEIDWESYIEGKK